METRELFALRLSIWDMATYIGFRDYDVSSNPQDVEFILFKSEDEAKEYASKLYFDSDIYNDAYLYSMEMTDEEILKISEFESIEDFEEAMKAGLYPPEKCSWRGITKPYGYDERVEIAKYIIEEGEDLYDVDCANYDIDKSIEGAIVVIWEWERYIGYARNFVELRYAGYDETEANLAKDDKVYKNQMDIVLTKEEVEECERNGNLRERLTEELLDSKWKWTKEHIVEQAIEDFTGGENEEEE